MDLKQFLDEKNDNGKGYSIRETVQPIVFDLGLFFWDDFVLKCKELTYTTKEIKHIATTILAARKSELCKSLSLGISIQVILHYAEDCLGEEKIKELIKGI